MTAIFSDGKTKRKGSFKLPYSLSIPTYKIPKLFTTQKTEEYFVTTLFAQYLLHNQINVIGVQVCNDDSNKKPDAKITLENGKIITVQVTRFTLTDYLNRRKIAENKVEKIIKEINKIGKIDFPVNVQISPRKKEKLIPNTNKYNRLIAKFIHDTVSEKKEAIGTTEPFIGEIVKDEKLKEYFSFITLQKVPNGHYSNYFGKDNIFIDLDFDNISFTREDIDKESQNIYNKKNNGEADVLLIWIDSFEVLYDVKPFDESLEKQFQETSFKEVYFFKFDNKLNSTGQIEVAQMKKDEMLYRQN